VIDYVRVILLATPEYPLKSLQKTAITQTKGDSAIARPY
jgi:hypothetical protein